LEITLRVWIKSGGQVIMLLKEGKGSQGSSEGKCAKLLLQNMNANAKYYQIWLKVPTVTQVEIIVKYFYSVANFYSHKISKFTAVNPDLTMKN
jgi:hypothetical protein